MLPVIILITFLSSCSKDDEKSSASKLSLGPTLNIDPNVTYQTIAGFGGANQMWGTQFPNATDMKKAFGTDEDQLGLSIFRIRIPSNRDEWARIVGVSQEAMNYNAKILASPWSPPAHLKSNGSDVGGYLPEENYGKYLEHINDFISFMASNNVDIYAISIQNEPVIEVGYESSDWSPGQMANFLREYGDKIEGAKVAAAESFNFTRSFTDVLLNNDEVSRNIDIIAGHIYGGGLGPYPLAEQKGKEIWMTEYLMNQGATDSWSQLSSQKIWEESLEMLETVHESMESNWNAYIWWYIKRYYSFLGDGSQGTTNGEILKRGVGFSHFSKFVRPGHQRIQAGITTEPDLLVTAYKGENTLIVQIINPTVQAKSNINFVLAGGLIPSSASTITSTYFLTGSKAKVDLNPDNSGSSITLDLQGKSITTVIFGL